ncbi:MAG TPA: metallophosphoesterase, partial [Gemmataceae bacterium]|nr:metallophosphoesterase [Gemmataceae bacterium]
TQPTLGNHETAHRVDWQDYWHQRPTFTSFTFGGVLFLDLDSNKPFKAGSAQYSFVQNELATAPACVVAYWHTPVLTGDTISTGKQPMWSLLANNGGDLVLNGHQHSMSESVPLGANLQTPGHMVQLISGAGGHSVGGAKTGTRIAWAKGQTPGVLYLTLNGAANGGTASSLTWRFKATNGTVLRTGSIGCSGP